MQFVKRRRPPTPPPRSEVDRLCAEIFTLARTIRAEYHLAWSETYIKLRSANAQIGSGGTYDDDGTPSNNLSSHLAQQESRRDAMGLGAAKLGQALTLLRSAEGLIDPNRTRGHERQWDDADLRAAEARYQDAKRA